MAALPRILKGTAPLPGRRVEAAVWDADRRVREMLAEARAQAGRILADAEAARARVRSEATEAGRREGQASVATLLALAALERDRILQDAKREVVTMALAVARKVLAREIGASSEIVVELAAAALAQARERRVVVLRVSPADAAAIRAARGRLAAALVRAPLEIREDPSLERGGAMVDTEAGRVDARVEIQLETIARAVEEALA